MRKVTLWAGQSPNVALPLAVKARDAFEYAQEKLLLQYFLDVGLDCTTHIACKCSAFIGGSTDNPYCGYGWGDYPDAELWAKARNASHGSLDVDGVVEGIISEYKRIGSRAYGPGADGSLGRLRVDPAKVQTCAKIIGLFFTLHRVCRGCVLGGGASCETSRDAGKVLF